MLSPAVRLVQGYTSMVVHAFVAPLRDFGIVREPHTRAALARQIVVTGVQSLPYACLVALLFGAVAVTRAFAFLGAGDDTVLKTVIWGALRELGPLITALIIIVRSGVAIAAEVALMNLRSGILDTHWRDLDEEDDIVLPRVLGAAVAGASLVVCFQFVAIASALVASSVTLGTRLEFELDGFLETAVWWQLPLSAAKGLLFGAGIAAIACWHGLQASRDMVDVPKAVSSACLGSFTFVMVVDLIAAGLSLL